MLSLPGSSPRPPLGQPHQLPLLLRRSTASWPTTCRSARLRRSSARSSAWRSPSRLASRAFSEGRAAQTKRRCHRLRERTISVGEFNSEDLEIDASLVCPLVVSTAGVTGFFCSLLSCLAAGRTASLRQVAEAHASADLWRKSSTRLRWPPTSITLILPLSSASSSLDDGSSAVRAPSYLTLSSCRRIR